MQSLSAFVALLVAFVMAPAHRLGDAAADFISRARHGTTWNGQDVIRCSICEHHFEAEDMAHCPAYSGPICSLCCSLETRCRDCCKPQGRISNQLLASFGQALPERTVRLLNTHVGRYLGVLLLFVGVIGAALSLVYFLISLDTAGPRDVLASTLWTVFFILIIIAGVAAWLFVLAQESRRVAEEENAPPDRSADERDRGAQAHRCRAAEGQGSRRSGQQGQEPPRRRPQPRIAHAAQRHPRLRPAPRARPGHSANRGSTR